MRLGAALGRPFAAALADPGARGRLADSGHLEMQEWLLRVARRFGWIRRLEVATRSRDPRYSIDVLLLVGSRLILVECWNTLRDFGAAIRSTHRKLDETEELRIAVGGTSVHACWLVRPTAANRELVHRYPEAIRTAFPESARWVRVFERGDLPPDGLDFVWLDPSVGVHALRIRGGERA
ncbi:MAG TPA: hypothetical protein VFS32_06285 [Candidatus Limnocylindrales bacterium]|nr:hypothetical protein [Candidatus Limnocylindrales bacterium]